MPRNKSINESVFENAEKDLKELKGSRIAIKLMAILAYKDHTSEDVSRVFKLSQRHFLKIVHDYKNYGIEGLVNHPRGHNASKLSKEQLSDIRTWVVESKTGDNSHVHWTLAKLQKEILAKYNVRISTVAISNHLHSLGLVVKMPRPNHYKGDKEKQDDFKKN